MPILKQRGLKVAYLKHYREFEIDEPGKIPPLGPGRADTVAISALPSLPSSAVGRRRAHPPQMLPFWGLDLVIAEGYKGLIIPKSRFAAGIFPVLLALRDTYWLSLRISLRSWFPSLVLTRGKGWPIYW